MLNIRIKNYMNDIIDIAFADKNNMERNRYKNFTLNILVKENTSTSGMYYMNSHVIEVYNPSLGARHLAKCCLHELSHHIDWCQHGISGHQKPFYEIYAKLIYASLDMGILELKDFDDHWSSDQNKVRAIVEKYEPHPISYQSKSYPMVRVYNGFKIKEALKQNGYKWNNVEQVWEKELQEESSVEESFLTKLGACKQPEKYVELPGIYYRIENPDMYVDAIVYIVADGNTYEKREVLKEYHFYFKKENKMWLCKVKASESNHLLKSLKCDSRLTDINFSILKRKK